MPVQPLLCETTCPCEKDTLNTDVSTNIRVTIRIHIKFFVLVAQCNFCFDCFLPGQRARVCVKGSGRTDATGLWKEKKKKEKSKPISVLESWGMALCIQTSSNQADAPWHGQGRVHKEGQGPDTLWQARTATRGTDRLYPCMHMHFAAYDAAPGRGGGGDDNSASVANRRPRSWAGMGQRDTPRRGQKKEKKKKRSTTTYCEWKGRQVQVMTDSWATMDGPTIESTLQVVYSLAQTLSSFMLRFLRNLTVTQIVGRHFSHDDHKNKKISKKYCDKCLPWLPQSAKN